MRDFRDAKAMAQTLRESLTTKAVTISHSESLELVSRMLGVADWNTLSALLYAERRETVAPPTKLESSTEIYPAVALRDFVPFPNATFPLFVGRDSSAHALSCAFEGAREIVLAIQRDGRIDEPNWADLYEVGVLGQLLELERLSDGTIKVTVRILRRVAVRSFAAETKGYRSEVANLVERPAADSPELVRRVVQRFEDYAAANGLLMPDVWLFFEQTRDLGRIADVVATRMKLPVREKYKLLATLDPVERLKSIEMLLDVSGRPFSAVYTATRQRALDAADRRHQQYATLEHLLLALIDDPEASAVLRVCNADLDALRSRLVNYLDEALRHTVIGSGSAEPTPAFRRVDRRAALHAQEVGFPSTTGANALVALFPETRSQAATLLAEYGVSRWRAERAILRDSATETG